MKKIVLISVVLIVVFYAFKIWIYKPYIWKKAINNPEQKLQLGSFIFCKQRGSNGSQSYETHYFIFKVTEIKDDYVRLSVVRQLSKPNKINASDFSTSKEAYQDLKKNIQKITITGILKEDLYKGDASYTINDYLLSKYPSLKKSRYYYEDIAERKDDLLPSDVYELQDYFNLVYSKDEIIKKGKLVPWILSSNNKPELSERLSENIDLIRN